MRELNDLYAKHGHPVRRTNPRTTSTGGLWRGYKNPDSYCNCTDEEVAALIKLEQDLLAPIAEALDLNYPDAYTTEEWRVFKYEAEGMLSEFNSEKFFERAWPIVEARLND